MPEPLGAITEHVEQLRSTWTGAVPAFAAVSTCQVAVESMTDRDLLTVADQVAQLRRDADAVMVRVAAEVAARSTPELGAEGLAKTQGFQSPAKLIAASLGVPVRQASKLVTLGTSTAQRCSFTGGMLPATYPHIAAVVAAGRISIEKASLVTGMLTRVQLRADADELDAVEHTLAEHATQLPFELLVRAVKHAETLLDQDGTEPRDEERWQARWCTLREQASGMTKVTALLDPVTAAVLITAITAIVTAMLRKKRAHTHADEPDGTSDGSTDGGSSDCDEVGCTDTPGLPVIEDFRSLPQMQADALALLAGHCLSCDAEDLPLAAVTVVARADIDTLTTGVGLATIDGIDQPVSAAHLRNRAVDLEILPMIMGGPSQPLDVGRRNRFFNRAQRMALIERDGGCASCGLNVSYTHAHHIRWWKKHKGKTNLDNGVMLCSHCHHLIHRDDWDIHVRNGQVWFTPPAHIDPDRQPRLGGKARWQTALRSG